MANASDDDFPTFEAPDKADLEKDPLRIKGQLSLDLKLQQHLEKMEDIF